MGGYIYKPVAIYANKDNGIALGAFVILMAIFFGLAATILPYWWFLAFGVFVAMVFAGLSRPDWAAYFLLLLASGLIPEFLTPNIPLMGGTVRASDMFIFLLVLMTVFHYLFNDKGEFNFGYKLFRPLYFFAALVAFSLLLGGLAFNNPAKYVAYEFRVCFYWLFAFVLAYQIKNEKSLKAAVWFVVLLSFVLAIVVIAQSITGLHLLASARVENLDSAGVVNSDVSRSTFGGYQNFVVFSIVYLIAKLSREEINPYLAIPLVMTMLAGIVVTFGRGVWAAALISIAVMAIWLGRRSVIKIGLAGLVSAIIVVVSLLVVKPTIINVVIDRVSSVERDLNGGESWRWRQGENAFALLKIEKFPFTGIGLGGEYQPIRNRLMSPEQTRMMHNSYLYLILKFGVLGIVFPIWLCLALWGECRKMACDNLRSTYKALVVAIGASLIMPVFTGVTQPEWMEHKGVLYMATLCGLLYSVRRISGAPKKFALLDK